MNQSDLNMIHATPALEAAYQLAQEAHQGQYRKGKNASGEKVPYIEHPLKVLNVLRRVGVTDEATLAAALLHDTIEDTAFNTSEKLNAGLIARGMETSMAGRVSHIVQGLTNAKVMYFCKRIWQADHIQGAEPEVKLIKIADQIPNMIDCIELVNPEITFEHARDPIEYINKALDVSKKASGINPLLDEVAKLVYGQARSYLEETPFAQRRPVPVELDQIVASARKKLESSLPDSPPARSAAKQFKEDPHASTRSQGVVRIALDNFYRVVGFDLVVDPSGDEAALANHTALNMIGKMESHPRIRVTTESRTSERTFRFSMKPSMNLAEFIMEAREMNAIGEDFARSALTSSRFRN